MKCSDVYAIRVSRPPAPRVILASRPRPALDKLLADLREARRKAAEKK